MTASQSLLAFADCRDLFDRALESDKGIRVKCASDGAAWHLRLRMHNFRRLDRKANCATYADDHPMYGKSVYDPIIVTKRLIDGNFWIVCERLDKRVYEIEAITGTPEPIPVISIHPPETLQIEGPKSDITIETIKRRL